MSGRSFMLLQAHLRNATTPSGCLQFCQLSRAPWPRSVSSDCSQDIPQHEYSFFRDEHPRFPMDSSFVTKPARIVDKWLMSDIEPKAEAGYALTCPVPESRIAHTRDELGGLLDVVAPSSIGGIDIGCGRLRHPRRQRYSNGNFKPDVRRSNRSP